jgi:serine/threonine protein phosphatase 1
MADAHRVTGEKLIVMTGDYVDRGPKSAQILDHLIAPPPADFRRICLAGNHEEAMWQFCRDPIQGIAWLEMGGKTTLQSYGYNFDELTHRALGGRQALRAMADRIPSAHLDFIARLPIVFRTPNFLFTHAGILSDKPVEQQSDYELLWRATHNTESDFEAGRRVIHGRSPAEQARAEGKAFTALSERVALLRIARGETPSALLC